MQLWPVAYVFLQNRSWFCNQNIRVIFFYIEWVSHQCFDYKIMINFEERHGQLVRVAFKKSYFLWNPHFSILRDGSRNRIKESGQGFQRLVHCLKPCGRCDLVGLTGESTQREGRVRSQRWCTNTTKVY